jgi:hypothetical protein
VNSSQFDYTDRCLATAPTVDLWVCVFSGSCPCWLATDSHQNPLPWKRVYRAVTVKRMSSGWTLLVFHLPVSVFFSTYKLQILLMLWMQYITYILVLRAWLATKRLLGKAYPWSWFCIEVYPVRLCPETHPKCAIMYVCVAMPSFTCNRIWFSMKRSWHLFTDRSLGVTAVDSYVANDVVNGEVVLV